MIEFNNLNLSQIPKYIDHISEKKELSKKDLKFKDWGSLHRGLMNFIINHTSYPYLVTRMNEFPILIKKYWNEIEDNPYNILSELLDFLFKVPKKNIYHHKILIEYQNVIHETFGLRKFTYFIPENDNIRKIKNDLNVVKIYLPTYTRDIKAYLIWLCNRMNNLNYNIKYQQQNSLINNWGKLYKRINKKPSNNNKLHGVIIVSLLILGKILIRRNSLN